jgi:hypothetical protein
MIPDSSVEPTDVAAARPKANAASLIGPSVLIIWCAIALNFFVGNSLASAFQMKYGGTDFQDFFTPATKWTLEPEIPFGLAANTLSFLLLTTACLSLLLKAVWPRYVAAALVIAHIGVYANLTGKLLTPVLYAIIPITGAVLALVWKPHKLSDYNARSFTTALIPDSSVEPTDVAAAPPKANTPSLIGPSVLIIWCIIALSFFVGNSFNSAIQMKYGGTNFKDFFTPASKWTDSDD